MDLQSVSPVSKPVVGLPGSKRLAFGTPAALSSASLSASVASHTKHRKIQMPGPDGPGALMGPFEVLSGKTASYTASYLMTLTPMKQPPPQCSSSLDGWSSLTTEFDGNCGTPFHFKQRECAVSVSYICLIFRNRSGLSSSGSGKGSSRFMTMTCAAVILQKDLPPLRHLENHRPDDI